MKTRWTSRLNANQSTSKKSSLARLLVFYPVLWAMLFVAPFTTAQTDSPPPSGFAPDRILVKPKPSADLTALHATLGTTVLRSFPAIGNLQIVQLAPGASVTNELAEFQQSGLVQYAEPDWVVHAQLAPNDNFYQQAYLWNFNNIGLSGGTAGADIRAPAAWDIQNTAPGIIVAVTDIGARLTHEDLAPKLWTNPGEIAGNGIEDDGNGYVDDVHGINAINNTGDPNNTDSTTLAGHGSHVSGIIGAKGNNVVGVVGVCWQVQLMECRFLETNATGY